MIDIYRFPNKGCGYIYRYISPNGRSYIGQTTTSLYKRSGKRGKSYRGCKVFYNAIQKYGFENFTVEILGEYPINQLNKKEAEEIYKYNSLIPNGYNIKDGGQNTSRKEHPVYCYNLDGTFYKKYFNQSDARKEFGVNGSDISKCMDGKLKFVRGKIWRREYTDHVEPVWTGKNGAKPVVQIDPETKKVINVYDSASAAARALGLSRPTGISKCCTGRAKKSAGYEWQFLQSSTTTDS